VLWDRPPPGRRSHGTASPALCHPPPALAATTAPDRTAASGFRNDRDSARGVAATRSGVGARATTRGRLPARSILSSSQYTRCQSEDGPASPVAVWSARSCLRCSGRRPGAAR
jgi:hypothetical protein